LTIDLTAGYELRLTVLMSEILYHSDIVLPAGFVKPTGRVRLRWTSHALRAAKSDRYGDVPVQDTMTLEWYDVVEVGTRDGKVSKIVFRGGLNKTQDIVIVLIPGDEVWTAKTVWINEKNDAHHTLDRSRYAA